MPSSRCCRTSLHVVLSLVSSLALGCAGTKPCLTVRATQDITVDSSCRGARIVAVLDSGKQEPVEIVSAQHQEEQGDRIGHVIRSPDGWKCTQEPVAVKGRIVAALTGDFDGDKKRDFATLSWVSTIMQFNDTSALKPWFVERRDWRYHIEDTPSSQVTVWTRPPPGQSLGSPMIQYTLPGLAVGAGDFDRDGLDDVVVVFRDRTWAQTWFGTPGGFSPSVAIPLGGKVEQLWIDDIDGDGWVDILGTISVPQGWDLFFARNTRRGTVAAPLRYPLGEGYRLRATLGDLNHDGRVDVAAAMEGYLSVITNSGQGRFYRRSMETGLGYVEGLLVADFDRDQRPDIAVENVYELYLLAGNGQGGVSEPASVAQLGSFIAAADVDGDGWRDVILRKGESVFVSYLEACQSPVNR